MITQGHQELCVFIAGLWIPIRMDPHSFSLFGKILGKKTEKMQGKLKKIVILLQKIHKMWTKSIVYIF